MAQTPPSGTMKICSRQETFELVSVNHSARTGGKVEIYFHFFNMKVYFVVSLEVPYRGDSNEYTKYTIFNIKKKFNLSYPNSAAKGFFSNGLKNEFETAISKRAISVRATEVLLYVLCVLIRIASMRRF